MGSELISCPCPAGMDTGRDHAASGFSLIELLVVIALLSVLSLGAVMAAGPRPGAGDPERFRLAFERERDLAVLGGRSAGLFVTLKGVQRAVPGNGAWQADGGELPWRTRAVLTVTARLDNRPGAPQLIFLPDGRSSAFALVFGGGARCESDGWTGLRCDPG